MTTRRQLERVIVYQAVCEKAAHDQAEFFMRKLDNERHVGGELLRERDALVAENQNLRRAAKRMIAAGTTRDLRRKLQGVFDGVMKEETKCPF